MSCKILPIKTKRKAPLWAKVATLTPLQVLEKEPTRCQILAGNTIWVQMSSVARFELCFYGCKV